MNLMLHFLDILDMYFVHFFSTVSRMYGHISFCVKIFFTILNVEIRPPSDNLNDFLLKGNLHSNSSNFVIYVLIACDAGASHLTARIRKSLFQLSTFVSIRMEIGRVVTDSF